LTFLFELVEEILLLLKSTRRRPDELVLFELGLLLCVLYFLFAKLKCFGDELALGGVGLGRRGVHVCHTHLEIVIRTNICVTPIDTNESVVEDGLWSGYSGLGLVESCKLDGRFLCVRIHRYVHYLSELSKMLEYVWECV
jgi:hypothetical protein